jgi:hypothetical protein
MRPPSVPAVEALTVDVIEAPIPGVTIVSEIEAIEVHDPSAEEPEESDDSTPSESGGR